MTVGSSTRDLAATGGRVLWTLTEAKSTRTITCALRVQSATSYVIAVALAGQPIARRRYPTRARAVGHAASLMERLTADGWKVATGIPPTAVD